MPFTPLFIMDLAIFIHDSLKLLGNALITAKRAKLAATPRAPLIAMTLLIGLLILWNIGFIFQWGTNLVPNRGPVDFSVVARNQVTVVPKKMVSFVVRYLKSRDQVSKEVEQEDLKELPEYNQRR